jgi:hypothetical protein
VALSPESDAYVQMRLHPEDVEAIASQVADRLLAQPPGRLVDTATLAEVLGVSPGFVRAHAEELGAVRIGDGPKARLRFDVERARTALSTASSRRPSQAPSTAGCSRPPGGSRSVPLLPVRGKKIG